MRLIVVRGEGDGANALETSVLRYALSARPLPDVILDGAYRLCSPIEGGSDFSELTGGAGRSNAVWVVPASWRTDAADDAEQDSRCMAAEEFDLQQIGDIRRHPWLMISNGRFAAHVSDDLSDRLLARTSSDVLVMTAVPGLLAYQERIRLAETGELVGYRRLYRDAMEPVPLPVDWPHHLLIRSAHAGAVLSDGLPREFGEMIARCRARGASVEAVSMAGSVIDLASLDGLLALSDMVLTHGPPRGAARKVSFGRQVYAYGGDQHVSRDARFVGPVLLGRGVCIEPGAVIVGPSILCDGCTVGRGALVDSSIVGPRVAVRPDHAFHRCVVSDPDDGTASERFCSPQAPRFATKPLCPTRQTVFRTWPRFSYPGCFKRIVDVIVASIVLILFAPVVPLIALAIKINSPGPVFFRDKRQGLHGRPFNCVKFRTMRVGAAEIQDKLRFVSEVDGPQFKMADDPRISTVGRFLRETYLDEIPQFVNVLCGQMSIVGPRPSPESENTLCPSWRDARLSVRPGITGLWQVYRTREPFKDFQEWIYYDTKYVQELSPQMDLWVCWCTFRKMVANFIRQF
ncbi:MAG TPA: sugar transferase [Sedimentisphaerales bacterium]|nr:sugar transferase [Sedimentisphaerales bacterium]HRS10177.1 sugar transferase [Sedimentisphaerales bacterium]HRV46883.1 sugar transferase [Sedimentisphaerales bacterium]